MKTVLILVLLMLSLVSVTASEPLDPDFLEWLGQVSAIEEMGVDIGDLLQAIENRGGETLEPGESKKEESQ